MNPLNKIPIKLIKNTIMPDFAILANIYLLLIDSNDLILMDINVVK